MIEPGTTINDKYTILSKIGAGGMGVVYKATQRDLQRQVAIKLLHPQLVCDDENIERFRLEAAAAGMIGHDNICEVTELGTTEDSMPYLVMPLLKGQSLAELIKSESLPLHRILDIISQCLDAAHAAHLAQIVHRDLKPENIFITQIGDRSDFVKLLDFGISKFSSNDNRTRLTRDGVVLGTPCYMAPEQAKGDKELDARVDIYACGVILYEAVTGRVPFAGDSYNATIYRILTDTFPPPCSLNPSLPPSIEQIILKAMARDPLDRYSTAAEMKDAIGQEYSRLVHGDQSVAGGAGKRTAKTFLTQRRFSKPLRGIGDRAGERPFTQEATNAGSAVGVDLAELGSTDAETDAHSSSPFAMMAARHPGLKEIKILGSLSFSWIGTTLILVHSHRSPGDEDWAEWVACLKRANAVEAVERIVVVTPGSGPSARQRQQITEIFTKNQPSTAVITSSRIGWGIMLALKWLGANINAFLPTDLEKALDFLTIPAVERAGIISLIDELKEHTSGFYEIG